MVQDFPKFSSLNPFSTSDFPGRLSAVLFTQGCPLRCSWCFNQELQGFPNTTDHSNEQASFEFYSRDQVIGFLKERQGFLDAIVLSGGEPLAQNNLESFIQDTVSMGYEIGIHTSGIYPGRLSKLIDLIDWVGLDVKTLPKYYAKLVGTQNPWLKIKKSIDLLLRKSTHIEVRTSTSPEFLSPLELEELFLILKDMGVKNYAVQELINPLEKTIIRPTQYTNQQKVRLMSLGSKLFTHFHWRSSIVL